MKYSLLSSLIRSKRSSNSTLSSGFTLVELLVVIFIGGLIISGLLYLAVELLTVDKRESTRTETQRDIQLALDYISNELKEAIYVYPSVTTSEGDNPPVADFLPPEQDGDNYYGQPVVAFWKQQKLPRELRLECAPDSDFAQQCFRGSSYTLVVYSLGFPDDDQTVDWQGPAQIIRYAMTEFETDGDPTPGYVSPIANNTVSFATWPRDQTPEFSEPAVLTDFVDDGSFVADGLEVDCPQIPGVNYQLSPSAPINGSVRSFYACVSQPGTTLTGTPISPAAQNQEIIVYLQGNAHGRSGIYGEDGFLPTLETRILSRGILDKVL